MVVDDFQTSPLLHTHTQTVIYCSWKNRSYSFTSEFPAWLLHVKGGLVSYGRIILFGNGHQQPHQAWIQVLVLEETW